LWADLIIVRFSEKEKGLKNVSDLITEVEQFLQESSAVNQQNNSRFMVSPVAVSHVPDTIEYKYNNVFAFLDEKSYTLDRISGTFRHVLFIATHPCISLYEQLLHIPDKQGQQSAMYQMLRRELNDDHMADLTLSIDIYAPIALSLGYSEDWRPTVDPLQKFEEYMGQEEQ
jgi:hypothetical protein